MALTLSWRSSILHRDEELAVLGLFLLDLFFFEAVFHLVFFFITLVVDVLLILNVELTPLQVNVVDVKVVLVQLHMDHLLTLLVHLILFQ